MTGYDPWLDARTRPGITVGVTSLIEEQSWWLPNDRVILISTEVEEGMLRNAALAHQLAHVDLETSELVKSVRAGLRDPNDVEVEARRIVAHRYMSLDCIRDAMDFAGVDGDLIAAELGVPTIMFADRLRFACDDERDAADKLLLAVAWRPSKVELWRCGQHLSAIDRPSGIPLPSYTLPVAPLRPMAHLARLSA